MPKEEPPVAEIHFGSAAGAALNFQLAQLASTSVEGNEALSGELVQGHRRAKRITRETVMSREMGKKEAMRGVDKGGKKKEEAKEGQYREEEKWVRVGFRCFAEPFP